MMLYEEMELDIVEPTQTTTNETETPSAVKEEPSEEVKTEEDATDTQTDDSPADAEVSKPHFSALDDDSPDLTDVLVLRAEIDSLKRELEESRAFYARLDVECAEFSSLYPDVSITSLPDVVWQSVKKGVPLSAAYALEVRRAEVKAQKARTVNRENSEMSSGALGNDNRNDFFSPSQVRSMSASEVRANYSKIIESMSKWH